MTNPALFFPSKSTLSCCCFLALSLLPPDLLAEHFHLPLASSASAPLPQRASGSSANCLLTFQGDISSPSHLLAVCRLSPLSHYSPKSPPFQLLMLYSSSLQPPSQISTTTKKLRKEAINMYYFNRRLKNKKLLQQLPSQNHGDYCKAEKPKKRQLLSIFKSLYSFLSRCGKRD